MIPLTMISNIEYIPSDPSIRSSSLRDFDPASSDFDIEGITLPTGVMIHYQRMALGLELVKNENGYGTMRAMWL